MYAQLGQDDWVINKLHGKRDGVFVDIGAHDGIELSNSYLLESVYGWRGVCVEPHPVSYEALRLNRNCMTLNKAAWSIGDTTTRFNCSHKDSMLSGVAVLGETVVETVSLNQLCDMVGPSIDYISIDTEGSEIEILKSFDASRYSVACWSVEHNYNKNHIGWLRAFFERLGCEVEWRKWDVLAWSVSK
jgi:FkbM family methyltransferase